jgi:hypothetical protein
VRLEVHQDRVIQQAVAARLMMLGDWRVELTPEGVTYDFRMTTDRQIVAWGEHKHRTTTRDTYPDVFLAQSKYRALRDRQRSTPPIYGRWTVGIYFVVSFADCVTFADVNAAVDGLPLRWMDRQAPRESGGTADTDRERGFYIPTDRMQIFGPAITPEELAAAEAVLGAPAIAEPAPAPVASGLSFRDRLPPPPGYGS